MTSVVEGPGGGAIPDLDAVAGARPRRWAPAWHLHVAALGAAATDRVVDDVVGPAVDWCRSRQPKAAWFFVRYWQNGPHVRLRFGDLDHDAEEHLDHLVRTRMAEVVAATPAALTAMAYRRQAARLAAAGEGEGPVELGDLWAPGVYRQQYRPELDRYGGAGLMGCSEALFQASSELALAFVRLHPPEPARAGLGVRATWAALAAVAGDERRRELCRRSAAGWEAWAGRGGLGSVPEPLALSWPQLRGPVPAPIRRWADQLGSALPTWREAIDDGGAERILHAHVHMLHNRLGLSIGQELNHYRALLPICDRVRLAPGEVAG